MPVNDLPNPGFDADASGYSVTNAGTITRDTTVARSAPASGLLSAPTANTANKQLLATLQAYSPGTPISVDLWARWKSGATPRNCRLDVLFAPSGTGTDIQGPTRAPSTTGWTRYSLENVVGPAGTTQVRLRFVLLTPAQGDAVNVDDLVLARSASLTDAPPAGGGTAFTVWDGAAEVPVLSVSVWDGTTETPVASSSVAP